MFFVLLLLLLFICLWSFVFFCFVLLWSCGWYRSQTWFFSMQRSQTCPVRSQSGLIHFFLNFFPTLCKAGLDPLPFTCLKCETLTRCICICHAHSLQDCFKELEILVNKSVKYFLLLPSIIWKWLPHKKQVLWTKAVSPMNLGLFSFLFSTFWFLNN